MGCACSKASQASQPGQDAQDEAGGCNQRRCCPAARRCIQSVRQRSPQNPELGSRQSRTATIGARKVMRQAAHSRARKVAPLIRPRAQKPAATSHNLKRPLWRTLE
eukprot:Skav204323  [mRNA]  locus=scaffold660:121453:123586:+ [translate_table: standard]